MIDVRIEARIELRSEPGDLVALNVAIEEVSSWLNANQIKHVLSFASMGEGKAVIKLSMLDAPSVRGWLISKGCPHGLNLREAQ